ncbi:NUDIX domain-containing protein [Sunxiuqinia sp. A32]|uniref:NUDIX domain-containing protein n=1 Tax=Sunxiuqinia sp. A32 TaxID=3461496 RepID=UPI0040460B3C
MFSDTLPVHVFQFCPRCGSANFIATGDRSKKCKECDFHYFFNTSAAAAGLIFNDEGKLLFTRRAIEPHFGMLDLPGGFIEPMETAEQAIAREIKEELGVGVKNLSYWCSFPNEYPFSGFSVFTLDLIFKVELETIEGLKAMDDISGFEFYHPHEIDVEKIPSYSIQQVIKKLIQDEQNS